MERELKAIDVPGQIKKAVGSKPPAAAPNPDSAIAKRIEDGLTIHDEKIANLTLKVIALEKAASEKAIGGSRRPPKSGEHGHPHAEAEVGDTGGAGNSQVPAQHDEKPEPADQGLGASRVPGKDLNPRPGAGEPSVGEMIGLCFVDFCQTQRSVYEAAEFELDLRKVVPDAKVQVGYRTSASQEAYFYPEMPKTSNAKGWVVTLGDALFLLPYALSATDFDTVVECFERVSGTMPKNLRNCLPATLIGEGKRWGVVDQGLLSSQPDERLQQWWAGNHKRKQANSQLVVNATVGTITPGRESEQQAADVLTGTTVGEEFVKYCKWLLQDVQRTPRFDDFLEALKRRLPGVDLSGSIARMDDDSTTVWQIYKGQKALATTGWLLPAIKSLNEFFPFKEQVFASEGMPTPETVECVQPIETSLMEAGGERTWKTREAGLVSVLKRPVSSSESAVTNDGLARRTEYGGVAIVHTPFEEELLKATKAAFVKACRVIGTKCNALTQYDLQAVLSDSGLIDFKPAFSGLNIPRAAGNSGELLQQVHYSNHYSDQLGDVWLLRFLRRGEEVFLATPRLGKGIVIYNDRIARLFPINGRTDCKKDAIEAGSVAGLVPCLVRCKPNGGGYEVVEAGSIDLRV